MLIGIWKYPHFSRVLCREISRLPAPGKKVPVRIRVTNAAGEPVQDAEVAVIVVDEAVLALSNYTLKDPMDVFYQVKGSGVSDYHGREQVLLSDPGSLTSAENERMNNMAVQSAVGAGGGGAAALPA